MAVTKKSLISNSAASKPTSKSKSKSKTPNTVAAAKLATAAASRNILAKPALNTMKTTMQTMLRTSKLI